MADTRTMDQCSTAPTRGFLSRIPSKTRIIRNEITRFQQRFDGDRFIEALDRSMILLRASVETFGQNARECLKSSRAVQGRTTRAKACCCQDCPFSPKQPATLATFIGTEEYISEYVSQAAAANYNPKKHANNLQNQESESCKSKQPKLNNQWQSDPEYVGKVCNSAIRFYIRVMDALPAQIRLDSKTLLGNKEKLTEVALTSNEPLLARPSKNEHCLNSSELPAHLEYASFGRRHKLPRTIIAKELDVLRKSALIKGAKIPQRALLRKLSDIQGINPDLEELNCGSERGNEIESQLVWLPDCRVCIDNRKLNEAKPAKNTSLPFMDQILERLAGNEYYLFPSMVSPVFPNPIDPGIKKRLLYLPIKRLRQNVCTTSRMPYPAYSNAPVTFQRMYVRQSFRHGEEDDGSLMDYLLCLWNSFHKQPLRLDTCFKELLQHMKDRRYVSSNLIAPNWDLPFELIAMHSDFAIGCQGEICIRWVSRSFQEFDFKVIDTKRRPEPRSRSSVQIGKPL
ncbi:hypothetical protein Tco_0874006 [Tanacetum coccineum]|uniref:Uncharacterized protein n=1 Tax=Tanacetum coccineum TaxID=301880 RepID=A0ABQ5BKF0_9ASTR